MLDFGVRIAMMPASDLVQKLCDASKKQADAFSAFVWPESVNTSQWFMSEELISLFGTDVYENMTDGERKQLSFYECVNFFSLNIHGERALMEGISARLYLKDHLASTPYLHYFVEEENKHMYYFGSFCTRYADKIYPQRKLQFSREYQPGEEDFLFFAKILIFEEVVDAYNLRMSRNPALNSVARQINFMHHLDEARHLVFGRELVAHLFRNYCESWSPQTLAGIQQYLIDYIQTCWKEYYNPDVYRDCGIANPVVLRKTAWECGYQQKLRAEITGPVIAYLTAQKILPQGVCLPREGSSNVN